MAHFAELDLNNKVLRVIVIDNNDVNAAGGDLSVGAEQVPNKILRINSIWKQTSYNNNFRKQFAAENYTYDAVKDIFLTQKPFPSWILNSNNDWTSPSPEPTIKGYYIGEELVSYVNIYWEEENLRWLAQDRSDSPKTYQWNSSNSTWDLI